MAKRPNRGGAAESGKPFIRPPESRPAAREGGKLGSLNIAVASEFLMSDVSAGFIHTILLIDAKPSDEFSLLNAREQHGNAAL
jgi:hypothetical protein